MASNWAEEEKSSITKFPIADRGNGHMRKRLATVESKLAEQAKQDAALPRKPPEKMPYAQ
jgi:hypothetical protein